MMDSGAAGTEHPTGSGFSILLVEDDDLVRARLEHMLDAAGYGVFTVSSCKEARQAAATIVFPLMIIDRELGDGDGIDLIAEFRKLCAPNRVFMMLLTARDAANEIARGLAAGADDYLSKRSSDEQVLTRLQSALRTVSLRSR